MDEEWTPATFLAALEATGELVLALEGSSMGARWAEAGALAVRSIALRPPRWGDVVVFDRNGRWYAHRVILRVGDRFWTKGDARWAWDRPLVRRGDILGVATALLVAGSRVPVVPSARATLVELVRAVAAWPALAWRRPPARAR